MPREDIQASGRQEACIADHIHSCTLLNAITSTDSCLDSIASFIIQMLASLCKLSVQTGHGNNHTHTQTRISMQQMWQHGCIITPTVQVRPHRAIPEGLVAHDADCCTATTQLKMPPYNRTRAGAFIPADTIQLRLAFPMLSVAMTVHSEDCSCAHLKASQPKHTLCSGLLDCPQQ